MTTDSGDKRISLASVPPLTLKIVPDLQELARNGADLFRAQAKLTLSSSPIFTVVLSGGHTPRAMFSLLASDEMKSALPWNKIHLFWGDERNVSPQDKESNYQMALEALLSRVPIPHENVHRIHPELGSAELAAQAYEKDIREILSLHGPSDKPCFDLVYLGLGGDGHTLSLFPDGQPGASINEEEPDRLVIAPWVPHLNDYRISLTPAAVNSSREIVFLVSGEEKSSIVKEVFEGLKADGDLPAHAIRPTKGQLIWLIDRPAASRWLGGSTFPRNEGLG
jgi:6-phosphogluconolactonase